MGVYLIQALSGLASASSLFLVASGLSIIFGVTRIVNFAHGTFYMVGAYVAYTLVESLPRMGLSFWGAILVAALAVALLGALVEILILRRIYKAPELFQLLATFGLVLVIGDLVRLVWGPEDLLGPRAPGLKGSIPLFGGAVPSYDLVLIALGPLVLGALWLLFHRTRFGRLVRAATQDRDMVAALGVNERWLFTGVFVLGSFLAGLGGAVQLPREALNHGMHHQIITEIFVVVVVGGMGSILGAFIAAVLISELSAFGILVFPEITLVLIFVFMAVVLVFRPWGLLGKPEAAARGAAVQQPPLRLLGPWFTYLGLGALALAALFPYVSAEYATRVATEVLNFALFAASLGAIMTIGGLVSFGHAAYFGLGAYGAALLVTTWKAPMAVALLGSVALAGLAAIVFGYFCVRLSGIYFAMLTLAFAQIVYAILFQWARFTGGDNGLLNIWPAAWASSPRAYYYLTLAVVALGIYLLRRMAFAPFGYTLRACRDSSVRCEATGINVPRSQWMALALSGTFAGAAGGLFAFLKGSVFPDFAGIGVSVDALVMVLLGGVQTLTGPLAGAGVYKMLEVFINRYTEYWQLFLGLILIALVLLFPKGLVGFVQARFQGKLSPAEEPA
ncbi:MAG: ABC transporter permease [Deltaproteobacteria bacterium]|nr:ABC transporter permease [Deltaproteobacteria bacterium]